MATASGPTRIGLILDWVRIGLLALALCASIPLIGILVDVAQVPWLIALTVLLLAYRVWTLVRRSDTRERAWGFWLAAPVVFALVWISPFFGFYSFTGYIEVSEHKGAWQQAGMLIVTGLTTALAQMGGPRSGLASIEVYAAFVGINLVIAGFIAVLERERARGVTKLQRTVAQLQASEASNALLKEQLVLQAREAGVLDERQRLSREIHDTVAQGLVGIITQLEAVADDVDPVERERVSRAQEAARDCLAEVRRAVRALASPRLDRASLPDAMAGLVADAGRDGSLAAGFVLDGDPVATRGDAELLRVCQEALANAVRHARASRVVVTLGYDPAEIRLDVRDDGTGFDPDRVALGHGLAGMRQRIARLGGEFAVETSTAGSCTVSAAIPR